MYISNCPSQSSVPTCATIPTYNSPTCCVAVILPSYSSQIIDINWDGRTIIQSDVAPPVKPPHSYLLGTDTLPVGYTWQPSTGRLFFPPGVIISQSQFAILTPPLTQSTCGSWDWTAAPICVFTLCKPCGEFS